MATPTHKLQVFSDGSVSPSTLTFPRLMRVKRDYEWTSDHLPRTQGRYAGITKPSYDFRNMKDAGANVHVGMPDQYAFQPNSFLPLKKSWQYLLMDVNCLAHWHKPYSDLTPTERAQAKEWWSSFVMDSTCFTNGTSWKSGYTDYIQGLNLAANKPIEWEQILCSGNVVMVLSDELLPMRVTYLATAAATYLHRPIQTLDITQPVPLPSDLLAMPWVCHQPDISTGEPLAGGRYGHAPFPQFDDDSRYLLLSKGGVGYYRADWLEEL